MMERLVTGACIAVIGLTLGCRSRSPTSPSSSRPAVAAPVPAPSPAPSPVEQTLVGYISDTAFRTIAGARIEVLTGPQAGTVMTSDADGRFSYTGTFAQAVTMRATKDGFGASTETARVYPGGVYAGFVLAPLAPPVAVAGNYTLTITADSACSTLPDVARTRSYPATVVAAVRNGAPSGTSFGGSVSGGTFATFLNVFWVGVAGDYVNVSLEGEGPSIVERVGENTFVSYYGAAGTTVEGSGVTTISAPFKGTIEYCKLKSPAGLYYECNPALAEVRETCSTAGSQLTLARR